MKELTVKSSQRISEFHEIFFLTCRSVPVLETPYNGPRKLKSILATFQFLSNIYSIGGGHGPRDPLRRCSRILAVLVNVWKHIPKNPYWL